MRRILAWVFRWPLVWLEDYDGEVNIRRAKINPFGTVTAVRMGCGIRTVTLLPNGEVERGNYVKQWCPAKAKAKRVLVYKTEEK